MKRFPIALTVAAFALMSAAIPSGGRFPSGARPSPAVLKQSKPGWSAADIVAKRSAPKKVMLDVDPAPIAGP